MLMGFVVALATILLLLIVLGAVIARRAYGVLIDSRKKVSLSQFQVVLWTWILLSGFITIALARVFAGEANPLGIAWDQRLWGLLGISVASTVGAGAIKSMKKGKEPVPAAAGAQQNFAAVANRQGLLVTNATVNDASFWDMFRGEEPANYTLVDIGKVQMFLFTIVAALAYFVTLWQTIATQAPGEIEAMPSLSEGLVFILGISHAGYLGNKWTDKQPAA
jgi:hypothetical protein